MPYMYILRCADGSFYTGSTWNLEKRLWEHENAVVTGYTSNRRPVTLVYSEYYGRRRTCGRSRFRGGVEGRSRR